MVNVGIAQVSEIYFIFLFTGTFYIFLHALIIESSAVSPQTLGLRSQILWLEVQQLLQQLHGLAAKSAALRLSHVWTLNMFGCRPCRSIQSRTHNDITLQSRTVHLWIVHSLEKSHRFAIKCLQHFALFEALLNSKIGFVLSYRFSICKTNVWPKSCKSMSRQAPSCWIGLFSRHCQQTPQPSGKAISKYIK